MEKVKFYKFRTKTFEMFRGLFNTPRPSSQAPEQDLRKFRRKGEKEGIDEIQRSIWDAMNEAYEYGIQRRLLPMKLIDDLVAKMRGLTE